MQEVEVSTWMVLAVATAATVLVVLVLLLAVRLLLRRKPTRTRGEDEANLSINIAAMPAEGPPPGWPQLEFYGVPVRMVVLVLAPAGRISEIPPKEKLRDTVDGILPGLAEVLDRHRPIFRRWPEQLSTQGFAQSFFNHMKLPGQAGKQTPWCSVAGKINVGDQQLLVGVVCCAASPNGLSTIIVEHEGQWRDVLRIRRRA